MKYLCYLHLLSFNHETITYVVSLIQKIPTFTFIFKSGGCISLPIKKKKFTVLQSPHVYKKSQETFELFLFKKTLLMSFTSRITIFKFYKYFCASFFNNLEIKLIIHLKYLI